MPVLSFQEALSMVLEHAAQVRIPRTETVALLQAAGRVLADPVAADRDQPPFHRATRDGFAVVASDFAEGARLKVLGLVRAGEVWSGGIVNGTEAVEIMTGAAIPAGTGAVAMIEHVEQANGEVWAAPGRTLRTGENIVPRGSEALAGEVLLCAGTLVGAAEIAVAAACGHANLAVRARPTVAIVATGDELVEIEETPHVQQIRNSNGVALAAMVAVAGGSALQLSIARDTREDVRQRMEAGRSRDLLLLSGGVSAGKYDLVEEVLAESGAEFFFTGVKMQPGRPVVFGRLPVARAGESAKRQVGEAAPEARWTYFFGLPGNPISTQVTFHCFVEPLLRAMCGAAVTSPRFVQATLAEDVASKTGLTRLLPASLRHDLDKPAVRLVPWQGSGDLAANARANCYAVLPDGRDLRVGDVIAVLLR